VSDIFSHITADSVRAERERTGNGMMECKREMERAALLQHIADSDTPNLRFILSWLVGRAL
jgi:hypothetical protein